MSLHWRPFCPFWASLILLSCLLVFLYAVHLSSLLIVWEINPFLLCHLILFWGFASSIKPFEDFFSSNKTRLIIFLQNRTYLLMFGCTKRERNFIFKSFFFHFSHECIYFKHFMPNHGTETMQLPKRMNLVSIIEFGLVFDYFIAHSPCHGMTLLNARITGKWSKYAL